jgi:opacity protein-like surface antigen
MIRAIILFTTLTLLCAAAASAADLARQDEDAPRYLDAKLVPPEGRAARDFVPRGWKTEGGEGELTGDLNRDGAPDKVLRLVEDVPVEGQDGTVNTRYRALVVLFAQPGGGFKRAAVATKLLGCTTCAGVLGDPEGGNVTLDIKNGVLNVHQLSGSREATDLTQRFRYDAAAGRFLLIGQDVETYDRAAGGSESVSTNYLTGARVKKKVTAAGRISVNTTARVKVGPRYIEDVDYNEASG